MAKEENFWEANVMLRLMYEGKSATTDNDCTRKSDEREIFVQRSYDRRVALERGGWPRVKKGQGPGGASQYA